MRIAGWIRVASTFGYAPSISTPGSSPALSHCGERRRATAADASQEK